jgi:hypothetical protein
LASLLHIGVIIGGPDWYLAFGAGQEMADMASQGSLYPATLTAMIAAILFIWALYAFSGAGLIKKLPFLKLGLITITSVYALRGGLTFPAMLFLPELNNPFMIWSSLVCCGYALCYGMGTYKWIRLQA